MNRIARLVNDIKEEHGTNCPFELCDAMDITVLDVDFPDSVNGIFLNNDGRSTIYLNNRLAKHERTVICAHELGHVILHENFNCHFIRSHTFLSIPRLEKEADYFCAYLLLDDAKVLFDEYGLTTMEQIACFYGVERRLVELRYGMNN
ncbi:MAG: ImmA/IrrE family metallo-endopeptidase [Clostridiales bacterium]|nr:ImmA/IrrE family metallo-endopeptidase [Clostridiales bacterium]